MPGIKDDSSLFLHLINEADLCRQPLAEWLKPSLNMVCRDHGNKAVQMERERRRHPAAWIPSSFPSVAFQHAAATCQQPGNYASSDIVNKDLWYLAGVYCSTVICHHYNYGVVFQKVTALFLGMFIFLFLIHHISFSMSLHCIYVTSSQQQSSQCSLSEQLDQPPSKNCPLKASTWWWWARRPSS